MTSQLFPTEEQIQSQTRCVNRQREPKRSVAGTTAGLALSCSFLVLLTVLLYGKCLTKFFAMEDFLCISWVQSESPSGVLRSFFTDNEYGVYRPISIHVYYGLCRFLFDLNPIGYHLVSLVSHILNVLLIFGLGLALTENRRIGFLAGATYLSRMSHYIGVFWAAGINEVWLALFYLISVGGFILFWKRDRRIFYLISLLGYLLALGSKESAIMLPFVLLGYGVIYQWNHPRKLVKSCLPFFVLLLGYLVLKLIVFKPMVGQTYEAGIGLWLFRNLISYVLFQFNITYLILVAINLLTDVSLLGFLQNKRILLCLLGVAMVSFGFLLYIFRARLTAYSKSLLPTGGDRLGAAGFIFFLITLAPALLLRNRIQQYYLMAPSIGFSLCMAWLLNKYLKKHAAAVVVAFMLAGAFVGYSLMESLPDGRTTTAGKYFLEDLASILKDKEDVSTIYVRNSDGFIYQVLWFGEVEAFLHKPVRVVFDLEDPNFGAEGTTLKVIYENGHLRELDQSN